jgi:hypothetical protein
LTTSRLKARTGWKAVVDDLEAVNGVEKNRRRMSRHLAKAVSTTATVVDIVDAAVAVGASEAGATVEMVSQAVDEEVTELVVTPTSLSSNNLLATATRWAREGGVLRCFKNPRETHFFRTSDKKRSEHFPFAANKRPTGIGRNACVFSRFSVAVCITRISRGVTNKQGTYEYYRTFALV